MGSLMLTIGRTQNMKKSNFAGLSTVKDEVRADIEKIKHELRPI